MSRSDILQHASLPQAWDSYVQAASCLGQYADLLEKQILDGNGVLPSSSQRYTPKTPRNYQSVPLYVAQLTHWEDDRDEEKPSKDPEAHRKRDGLEGEFHDPRISEKSRGTSSVQRQRIPLRALASHAARPGLRVLSGGAGSGKSFLALFATVELIQRWRKSGRGLPILCSAETLFDRLPVNLQGEGASAFDSEVHSKEVASAIVNASLSAPWFAGQEPGRLRERLVEMVLTNELAIVVDGLDQVSEAYDRLAGVLKAFAAAVGCGLLVTGRPYAMSALLADLPLERTFETLRWREYQIQSFARCQGQSETVAQSIGALSRNPATAENVSVPQLLAFSLELLTNRKVRDVEELRSLSRAELYSRLVTLRLERTSRDNLKDRVAAIAAFALRAWNSRQGGPPQRVRATPKDAAVFDDLVKAGLLSNVLNVSFETSEAEWSHRSILEYFVALAAISRIESLEETKRARAVLAFATWGFDVESHELLRFAYGRLVHILPDLAEQLLAELADFAADDGALTRLSAAMALCREAPDSSSARNRSAANARWSWGQATIWDFSRPPDFFSIDSNGIPEIVATKNGTVSLLRDDLNRAVIDGNWMAPRYIADALSRIGDSTAAEPLRSALERAAAEGERFTAADIALSLWRIGDSDAAEPLRIGMERAVAHGDWRAAEDFVYALGRIGSRFAADTLHTRLERTVADGDRLAACITATRLGFVRNPASAEPLRNAIEIVVADGDWSTVESFAFALGLIGDVTAARQLRNALESAGADGNWRTFGIIATALGKIGDATAEPLRNALKSAVAEGNWSASGVIATALGKIGDAAVVELIRNALEGAVADGELSIASTIARAIGHIGDVASALLVQNALGGAVAVRQWEAAEGFGIALGRIGNFAAAEPLRIAFDLAVAEGQWNAARVFGTAIGRLGDAAALVPLRIALEGAVADADWSAVKSIVLAFGKIGDAAVADTLRGALGRAVAGVVRGVDRDIASALGRIGESIGPMLDGLKTSTFVQLTDAWFQGLAEHPDAITILQSCPDEAAFLEHSPGTAFRFYSSLVRNLTPDQPRHWHRGRWKTTSELVIRDF